MQKLLIHEKVHHNNDPVLFLKEERTAVAYFDESTELMIVLLMTQQKRSDSTLFYGLDQLASKDDWVCTVSLLQQFKMIVL